MAAVESIPLRLAYLADPNSVHTRRWIGFFATRGHEVHLLVGTDDEVRPGLHDRVQVHRYRRFGRRRLPFISSLQGRRSLRGLLAKLGPDVLHAHFVSRYGWQARLSGFHPYVVTPWGSDLFVTPVRSMRARLWARWTLRGADLVTVVSTQMEEAAVAAGARRPRIRRIQFGVDTERFKPGPVNDSSSRRLGSDGRFVFSPRSLRPLYRHETVLEAMAALPSDVRVVMSGRNADPAYRTKLEASAAGLGLTGRITIVDEIDDDDMLAFYRSCAAVVSVPESDGLPVTVLEAMACGSPVVASDLPAVRELLEPVASDLIVPVGDAHELSTALRTVLEMNAGERLAMGMALRTRVVSEADQATNMVRMEGLYRQLAGRA